MFCEQLKKSPLYTKLNGGSTKTEQFVSQSVLSQSSDPHAADFISYRNSNVSMKKRKLSFPLLKDDLETSQHDKEE